MTKKRETQTNNFRSSSNNDALYAEVNLTEADRSAFENWLAGVSIEPAEALELLADEGYRITFKIDFNNSCAMCTLTQQDNKHHNAGLIITSRSDDLLEAFWLNAYKVLELYQHQRLPTKSDRALWG